MSRILIIFTLMLFYTTINAQNIGINETGNPPHPSAMLDIVSPDKGILIPRLPDHTAIAAPAQGLLVYNSTGNGFWYWDGTQWLPLLGANAGWQILGNAGIDPLINYLGTTDAAPLMFRVNSTPAGRIDWDDLESGSTLGRKGATAVGYNSLSSLSSGYYNTAFGFNAGNSITTGFGNTIMGYRAAASLLSNHSSVIIGEVAGENLNSGDFNIFIGKQAANSLEDGERNMIFGGQTARFITEGDDNIIMGYRAGYFRTASDRNILIGTRVLGNAAGTSGDNIIIGFEAARQMTSGYSNVMIGNEAGLNVTTGYQNVYIGELAGRNKNTGNSNVAIGWGAMAEIQTATLSRETVAIGRRAGAYSSSSGNVFVGYNAGLFAASAASNTFVGARSGEGFLSGSGRPGPNNSFFGFQSGNSCRGGCAENTFLGTRTGELLQTGTNNVFIGYRAGEGFPVNGTSNRLVIANNLTNNDILIYGEFDNNRVGINTIVPEHTLSVNGSAGKPGGGEWATFSDRRVKSDISVFEDGLNVVMKLEPIKYRYNKLSGYSETEKEYIGFIAQDVEMVAPYMVTLFDDSEGPSKLSDKRVLDTSALNQILVNAIQEQQEHIQTLEDRVNHLESLLLKVLEEKEAMAEKK
jgi:hypothetical protein